MREIKKILMQIDKELIIDNLLHFDFFNEIKSGEDIPENPFIYRLLKLNIQKKEQNKKDLLEKKWEKALNKKSNAFKKFMNNLDENSKKEYEKAEIEFDIINKKFTGDFN